MRKTTKRKRIQFKMDLLWKSFYMVSKIFLLRTFFTLLWFIYKSKRRRTNDLQCGQAWIKHWSLSNKHFTEFPKKYNFQKYLIQILLRLKTQCRPIWVFFPTPKKKNSCLSAEKRIFFYLQLLELSASEII
jgi:hypothetical protein